jgi:hypothetical protein
MFEGRAACLSIEVWRHGHLLISFHGSDSPQNRHFGSHSITPMCRLSFWHSLNILWLPTFSSVDHRNALVLSFLSEFLYITLNWLIKKYLTLTTRFTPMFHFFIHKTRHSIRGHSAMNPPSPRRAIRQRGPLTTRVHRFFKMKNISPSLGIYWPRGILKINCNFFLSPINFRMSIKSDPVIKIFPTGMWRVGAPVLFLWWMKKQTFFGFLGLFMVFTCYPFLDFENVLIDLWKIC